MRSTVTLCLTALLLLSLTACEENISPTLDTGRPFSLWGSLDPTQDTQAIRVVPIALQIGPDIGDTLDAEVISRNLISGEIITWENTIVEFANGQSGWVATAPFRPEYGETFRITATRSDGASAAVTVEIPEKITPIVSAPTQGFSQVDLPVLWPEAPRLHDAEIHYLVANGACNNFFERDYSLLNETEPFEFGWETAVPLAEHAAILRAEEGGLIGFVRMTVRGLVADTDWKPPYPFAFDPEIIIEPGSISNVENGFGFVGASYRTEIDVVPDEQTLRSAGFAALCLN